MDDRAGESGRSRWTTLGGGRKPATIVGFAAAAGLTMCVHSSAQKTPPSDSLAPYAALVSELDLRRRVNVLHPNPQSIFDGLHVGHVNVGAGNSTLPVESQDRLERRPVDAYLGNRYLSAIGDFDDDGRVDEAFFARVGDENTEVLSLVVSFGSPTRRDRILLTLEEETDAVVRNVGLEVARAGPYTGACARGFGGPCEEGEEALDLSHDGIVFFGSSPPQGSIIFLKTHWTVTSRCSTCPIDLVGNCCVRARLAS